MTGRAPVTRRIASTVLALVSAVAPALLALVFATPAGVLWADALRTAVDPWAEGGSRLFRGGLRWIAPPAVTIAVLWCFVHLVRTDRRRTAVIAFVLGAGSFLTTEAIKFGVVPFPGFGPEDAVDLSGHVAMTAAAAIVFVMSAPPRLRNRVCWLAGLLLAGASFGVIAARWHDIGEVVIPLAIATAWALVCRAVLATRRTRRASVDDAAPVGRGRRFAAACAIAAAFSSWLLLWLAGPDLSPERALAAASCAIAAAAIVTTAAAAAVARQV